MKLFRIFAILATLMFFVHEALAVEVEDCVLHHGVCLVETDKLEKDVSDRVQMYIEDMTILFGKKLQDMGEEGKKELLNIEIFAPHIFKSENNRLLTYSYFWI